MAVTVYKSSDASAPALDGTAGSLIAVLDACLVNGYGAKSAAGWTKPFSGTNTAVYLGSAGHYLDVNDNGAGAGTTKEATVRGYEAMTAVATGTNPFPTTAQAASPGLYLRKSSTATSTARAWVLFADGTTFHLFVLTADSAGRYSAFSFGRFYSFKSGDTYRTIIQAYTATAMGSNAGLDVSSTMSTLSSGLSGTYTARVQAGTGTSQVAGMLGVGSSLYSAPYNGANLADSNLYLSRLFVPDSLSAAGGLRGYIRGVYQLITGVGLNDGDTFSGTGDFAGRTFVIVKQLFWAGYIAVETSAWDSSA